MAQRRGNPLDGVGLARPSSSANPSEGCAWPPSLLESGDGSELGEGTEEPGVQPES